MNLKFEINDYILIWNLLFQASISEEVQKFKQKLWKSYKHSYNALYKEKEYILKDPKNYIPTDDTIFDMVKNSEMYQNIKKETEEYRLEFLKCWDERKRSIIKNIKEILRFDIKIYHVLIVNPKLDIVEAKTIKGKKTNTILWGRRKDKENYLEALCTLLHIITQKELENYQREYKEIVQAVLELAIDNELTTRILGKSVYLKGEHSLKFLKKQIYPYFLMYLGYQKEEILNCMVRDSLVFDLDKYSYETQLKNLDLFEFIDFCIRHQKNIIKINELEII